MSYRLHTDDDFNSSDRYFESRLDLYLTDDTLISFTASDIISMQCLEELSAEDNNPLGKVSANTLEVVLFNGNNMLSPLNGDGPYYGKLNAGMKIIPFLRIVPPIYYEESEYGDAEMEAVQDELDWITLGTFYVVEWATSSTDNVVNIVAMDKLYQIFNSKEMHIPIIRNITFEDFLNYYFAQLDISCQVDATLNDSIPYAYIEEDIAQALTILTQATLAFCYVDRNDDVCVVSALEDRVTRALIDDNNQIMTIESQQSMIKAFDDVDVIYSYPQLSAFETLLEISKLEVAAEEKLNMQFNKGPVESISAVCTQTLDDLVQPAMFKYTPWSVVLTFLNAGLTDLSIIGTIVNFTEVHTNELAINAFKYANTFIQSKVLAAKHEQFLSRFITSDVPILSMHIRGNLLLRLGDEIEIESTKYDLTFKGIILRMQHYYRGGFNTKIVLLNSDLLKEE